MKKYILIIIFTLIFGCTSTLDKSSKNIPSFENEYSFDEYTNLLYEIKKKKKIS